MDFTQYELGYDIPALPVCGAQELVDRLLHGSDYPVPVLGAWAWMRGLVDWETYRRWENCPNPIERDYQLKRAMGFPAESFSRIRRLLRISESQTTAPRS